ncbi:hypothetical protein X766_31065 [Mesorhizobium sp. LSJC255A00]|uniref:DUF3102 domain-containing protein n=1 Tax=Mesorhizobium sp. LSJC255A00 TaxID=1287313 RepID=UPI0003CF66BF|nr:DUF3102 domain-containing protein [Mesorhizobium sp. LSJC255A00]ESX12062.1 hypothetical protein X766_31065 [Mesorhizobium sp. LSJC255A00]
MTDNQVTLERRFDYAALPADQAAIARAAAEFIGNTQRRWSTDILEIGRKLTEVKTSLGHGHFTAWVESKSEFMMSLRTAQNYMLAAATLGSKSEAVSFLPTATLLEMAKAPEPVRDDLMHRIEEASKLSMPMPVKAVNIALADAKDAEKVAREAAKKSPEAKAREKAKKLRWDRERELDRQKREADRKVQQRADYELATLLIERFKDDKDTLVLALEKAGQRHLADLLDSPYGWRLEGYRRVPNERPTHWDADAHAG